MPRLITEEPSYLCLFGRGFQNTKRCLRFGGYWFISTLLSSFLPFPTKRVPIVGELKRISEGKGSQMVENEFRETNRRKWAYVPISAKAFYTTRSMTLLIPEYLLLLFLCTHFSFYFLHKHLLIPPHMKLVSQDLPCRKCVINMFCFFPSIYKSVCRWLAYMVKILCYLEKEGKALWTRLE